MPATYSGRHIKYEGIFPSDHPSLLDIAIGLSRQPRFAGQTTRWWSVLDHTLFGHHLILEMLDQRGVPMDLGTDDDQARRRAQVLWLLHDAHESLTGDIPTDLKPEGMKLLQTDLDRKIFDAFVGPGWTLPASWPLIKDVDRLALVAEARVVGNAKAAEIIGQRVTGEAVDAAEMWLRAELWVPRCHRYLGVPPFEPEEGMYGQDKHPAVERFLRLMNTLL